MTNIIRLQKDICKKWESEYFASADYLALVVGFTYEPQRKEERLARNNKTVQY